MTFFFFKIQSFDFLFLKKYFFFCGAMRDARCACAWMDLVGGGGDRIDDYLRFDFLMSRVAR